MFQVIALDGGGTTGWAVFDVHDIAMQSNAYPIIPNVNYWCAGEFEGPLSKQSDLIRDLTEAWEDAEVVAEDFILRRFLTERSVLDPVRLNAMVEQDLNRVGRRLHYQTPSLAMTTITDDRLKEMGYYHHPRLMGKPHARDSVRHALTWLRRRKVSIMKLGLTVSE